MLMVGQVLAHLCKQCWMPAQLGSCPARLPRLPSTAGGPFNLMSRRVLGTNAHLAEAVSGILADCPCAPDEPLPQPLPE